MENEKVDKKKYLNILTIVISIIIITLVGTYALKLWTSTDNTELTFRIGDYTQVSLNCKSGEDVTINNICPVYDYLTDGEVIPFSVIATKSNTSPLNIKFNINTISDNLKEISFKYVLLSSVDKNNYNEELRGSFVNSENNTSIILVDNLVLTTSRYYKLIIYIDGNMENPISMQNGSLTGNVEMCMEEEFDVSLEVINGTVDNSLLKVEKDSDAIFNITPSSGYKLEIDSQTCNGVIDSNTGNYTITNITENKECSLTLKRGNLDTSGANSPDLVDGLIPVMHNGTSWVVADYTNSDSNYRWYDYNNRLWANAVLVTETKRNSLNKDSNGNYIAGQTIGDTYNDGTLAFYIWIPRYKYKVWNINKVIGTASYDAYNTGIDIVFESEKSSTGTISCTYSYASPSSTAGSPNEVCTGSNGDYYTHPAFTFGNDEVRGFWIGKFEVSSSNPSTDYGGWTSSDLEVRILPNVISWRVNTISNFNIVIQNMQKANNIYGLTTSRTNTDSHMITNMEWGAVAYLTNSKYGRCIDDSCTEVTINNCSSYITGIGADSVSASSSSTTCTADTNKYNGTKGVLASTTGNITGGYDMSGGSFEKVIGNMSSAVGSYIFYSSSSGFASTWYTTNDNLKYVTTYAYGTSYTDQTAYNRTRLGDATGEVIVLNSSNIRTWYNDTSNFFTNTYSWLMRGNYYYNNSSAGIFSFSYSNGGVLYGNDSTRAALIGLS